MEAQAGRGMVVLVVHSGRVEVPEGGNGTQVVGCGGLVAHGWRAAPSGWLHSLALCCAYLSELVGVLLAQVGPRHVAPLLRGEGGEVVGQQRVVHFAGHPHGQDVLLHGRGGGEGWGEGMLGSGQTEDAHQGEGMLGSMGVHQ